MLTASSNNVYCDFETQSAINLKKEGAKRYLDHYSTRVMSGVFMRGDRVIVWVPYSKARITLQNATLERVAELPKTVRKWVDDGCRFIAHNAELFDSWLWEKKIPYKSPIWSDTIHLARQAGLPGKLEQLLPLIGAKKGDNTPMQVLMEAKETREKLIYVEGTAALWGKLIDYNITDVIYLEKLYEYLLTMTDRVEDKVRDVHTRINRRGFMVDRERVKSLLECWSKVQQNSKDAIQEITNGELKGDDIRSPAKVKKWLESIGIFVPSLDKKYIDQILANPSKWADNTSIAEDSAESALLVLAERQNAVRATTGKLERILLEQEKDGSINRCLIYCGAQATGRFSATRVQPHNFPRGSKVVGMESIAYGKVSFDAICNAAIESSTPLVKVTQADVLSTLTRSVIVPRDGKKFVIFDYSNIEARAVAYLAKCNKLLKAFVNGDDPYCMMASSLFGRTITKKDETERFIGKQIVLGCGYGMGAEKFELMMKVYKVDLHKVGLTGKKCIDTYRKTFKEIPKLWKDIQKTLLAAINKPGEYIRVCRCIFHYLAGALSITLPSGRKLRYRGVKCETVPSPWREGETMQEVTYLSPYGYRKKLYGGLCLENISQAMSSDFLRDALVRLDNAGIDIVLHVHDEIVSEVDADRAEKQRETIGNMIVNRPVWAPDFPLEVEGFIGSCYNKGPIGSEKSYKFS